MDKLKRFNQELLGTSPKVTEIACAFVWFHYISTGTEVSIENLKPFFKKADLPDFNPTRLRNGLRSSNCVVKGSSEGFFRPMHSYSKAMGARYSFVAEKSEDVVSDDTIIPDSLVTSTRGYIILLSRQINASYNNNIFDGCAVLMRRLLEILLIHSFEAVGKTGDIKDVDGYKNLSTIINITLSTKPFSLAKESAEMLNTFRELGNFSAHGVAYNCRRGDIDNVRLKFRLAVEELLYRATLKK